MKFKILIKLLYLIILFALATYRWEEEPRIIDSDPGIDTHTLQQAFHEA